MNSLWQDLRYGARMLLKRPGFTLIAVLTLALGIGANTAIFSVVNAVLLRPLPYPESERLVMAYLSNPQGQKRANLGMADFLAVRERNQSFEKVAMFTFGQFAFTGGEQPEQISGAWVSADFFATLGVAPAQGRAYQAEDERPENARMVVISDGFWRQRLAADSQVIGKTITLNSTPHTVIGVMPKNFHFPLTPEAELWPVRAIRPATNRPPYFNRCVGRLKPGVSEEQARADLSAIAAQVHQQFPESPFGAMTTRPLIASVVGDVRQALLLILGAVAFVLLIASANVANLQLARAASREREMSVRLALGANRWRIVRQLLTESLLLAAIGGLAGWGLAFWGVDLFRALGPVDLPRLQEVSLDGRALGFTMLAALVSGLLFGLAPALQSSRMDLNESLKEGGRAGSEGRGRRRVRGLLVVAEMALTLVLLVGAGLLLRSFLHLQEVNPGFNPKGLLTAQVSLPQARYGEEQKIIAFHRELMTRAKSLPGVQSVGISMSLPPNLLEISNPFAVEGRPPAPGQARPLAEEMTISPDYFTALGVPLLRGRFFNDADKENILIINEAMARRYFPNEDPVGKRLQTGDPSPNSPWETIVGVVGNVKYTGLDADDSPTMYVPYTTPGWASWSRSMYLVVRTTGAPSSLASALRREVNALDGDLPLTNVRAMEQVIHESVAEPRFRTSLLGLFAAVALLLAGIGIYGVISYAVTERRHEIGIRMALGAQRGDVMRLVVKQGMLLAGVGIAIGLAASLALTRLMKTLLFGVSATDPLTFGGIALLLALVALAACWIPARRATKVDPMIA
ncbi:MAG TPA: ABC transporter permease, partial [Blastocatellia bacterium]|nr:ABC transporter permease [Blastocatellia bacterium]